MRLFFGLKSPRIIGMQRDMDKQFDARIQFSISNIFRQFGYSIPKYLHFQLANNKSHFNLWFHLFSLALCSFNASPIVCPMVSNNRIENKTISLSCHTIRLVEKEWLRLGATLTFRYLFCGISNDQHMNKYLLKLQFFPPFLAVLPSS